MKFWPLLILLSFSPLLISQKSRKPAPASESKTEEANWIPTFVEEFNGRELDLARWAPHDPWGRVRDRQLQAWSPEALEVNGGQLHIVARRASGNQLPVRYDGKDREYISGIISTFGTFAQTYGRFEIRCRVPSGRGLGAGFFLLPVSLGLLPEIDIFQGTGSAPSRIFFANRWGTEQTERSYGDSFTGPDLSDGFHTIDMEWDRDSITWSVDGKKSFQSADGVPRQPMYMLLDLAVGGNLARTPDSTTRLPASFDIDYIHVYRRK